MLCIADHFVGATNKEINDLLIINYFRTEDQDFNLISKAGGMHFCYVYELRQPIKIWRFMISDV